MKITFELTTEEFKANGGKTLEEILIAKGTGKAAVKKTSKKEEEEEAEEEEEETEETEEEEEETEEEEEGGEVDDDLIKAKISTLSKAGKQAQIKKVFAKYKCTTISGLKQKDYDAFYADLGKIKK